MIVVGLTGGIGSGKTTVAKQFEALGVPVYIADKEAKKLMRTSKIIKRKLIQLFGESAYIDRNLNKSFIADTIFNDATYLKRMNAIIHPKVAQHFKRWIAKQNAAYVIKEVAILFENDGYKQCDYIITVTAPKTLRIKRLLKRDDTTLEKIEAIMRNQWPDEKKVKHSHYVINNIDLAETKKQVHQINRDILKKIQ
ncbi:dephospho-CoA kinase [Snuella sedimenti]|uniref:Dephospho-CoA kinase n=1 Tax=Snuella sedimenti TaxID=2798802 RepID=A0A8J7IXF8_9FLAO|nr:dephospho-CoA kinase [Snuella sedimenti]MBJ6369025.1 dephospho-CoA kinase [Snuella sedimenti]